MSLSMDAGSSGGCPFERSMSILREIPFFSSLPLDSIKALAYVCKRMKFPAGESVFNQQDEDSNAYFVLSGALVLERDGEVVESVSQGQFLGGLALLTDVQRLFTLRAQEAAEVLVIPRKKFFTDMTANEDTAAAIFKGLASSLVHWEKNGLSKEDDVPRFGVSLL